MLTFRKWVKLFFLTMLSLLFLTTACFAAPKIRVGWYLVPGLQEYDLATDKYSGYNYDYLKAVAQYTGWEYEFVVESLSDCLNDMRNGKIDLIGNLSKTEAREKEFLYTTFDAGRSFPRLITRADNKKYSFQDYAGFNGMVIGMVQGSFYENLLPGFAASHNFQYQGKSFAQASDIDKALAAGQIDAAIISGMRVVHNARSLAQLPIQGVYFICPKDKPWIKDQFDQTLAKIRHFDKSFDDRLINKYFSDDATPSIAFSVAEQEYLRELMSQEGSIKVSYDPAWEPIESKDPKTGEYTGIGKDIFDLISQKSGLKFQFFAGNSFKDTLEQYGGTVELVSLLSYDFDWADQLNVSLTQPILYGQVFKVYNSALEDECVALPENYFISRRVQERNTKEGKKVTYKFYKDTTSCLEAVRNREANSTYINNFELNYLMDKIQLEKLDVQSIEGFTIPYAIGVSKRANPLLLSIMSRCITGISPSEVNHIVMSKTQKRLEPSITDRVYANPVRYLGGAVLTLLLVGVTIFLYLSNRYNLQQRQVLQDTNEAKSEFLSRVSHDIRTPINAIINMTNFAREDIENKNKVKEELDKISTSSNYLLSLLNDVLDISKAESNKIELHQEIYPFEEYVQSIRNIFNPLCHKNNLNFIMDVSKYPLDKGILVDKVRLNQVVMNILSNAVKYTPAGGTITYSSYWQELTEGLAEFGFTVHDTGIGMSKQFQKIMFDPFSQEHNNPGRQKVMAGTGLGLSIVKKIVDLMNGTISVESEVGKGTKIIVHLTLPMATGEQISSLATKYSDGHKMALVPLHGSVLLAEDNAINTEIALRLLHNFGLNVHLAQNGWEAVNLFKTSEAGAYDVVLMDIQMPVMNGYDAAKEIRALPRADAKKVPIIAMTADVFADAVEKSKDAGMNGHVPKPINKQFLYNTLAEYLDKQPNV
jgi:two-component system sensor histidine kinase EvgS